MFSGAYIFLLASFVNLLSIKDSIGIDLIDLSVYQDGDCEPETQLQKETGRCPTRLVSPSSRHCTPWAFEVEEHHTYPWKPPFQRHEFSLSSCRSNDDDESCSMEMPHLSAIEEEQCNVLFRMPATMAKRDRPVLCTRLEADGTDGPRPVSAVTMAAASTTRLASALAVDIFERKDTFSEAKTTAKERQRQQDPQTEPAAADAGSAHDDAGCSHGADCTDACHVPPAGNAVSNARDNASIAPTRCSMATACQSQFGENASSSSCCTTSDGYAFYPHDASTANAKNAGDIDDIKFRHRCRGQRADDHDEGKTIRATRGYAKKVQKVLTKFGQQSSTDLHAAVTALDTARQNYDEAVTARNQHHNMWKKFLSDAVQLWQTYAQQFMEQEKKLQEQVRTSKDALLSAKKDLENSKLAKIGTGDVQNITSDEETEDPDSTSAAQAATKITETMEGLASSLQSLHQEAEAMVAEEAHAAKRPRTTPKAEDAAMEDPKHGSHFGKAG